PGHVELSAPKERGGADVTAQTPNATATPAQQPAARTEAPQVVSSQAPAAYVSGVARVAAVANVAEVARVAPVANVATVATVATVGGGQALANANVSAVRPKARVIPASLLEDERRVTQAEPTRRPDARGDVAATALSALSGEGALTRLGDSGTWDVAATRGIDMSERVAAILDVQNRAQDRPVSSLLLRLEHPELGEDRLRVDLRNNSVGATLDVANARTADQLNAHIADLRRALEAQGLEPEHLTIRHAVRAPEAPAPVAERDAMRAVPLPPDSNVVNALTARDHVATLRSSSRSSDHQQPSPDQRQQRGRKDPQGGR
ncbi:MAG: flagellar hook-length control protein FliK, partial [Gemmatimonadota bacterium]